MRPDQAWSVTDILQYLDKHHLTIFMPSDGVPQLKQNRQVTYGVIERVLPHLKARRQEIIEWFKPVTSDAEIRAAIIKRLATRAVSEKRKLFMLWPNGRATVYVAEPRDEEFKRHQDEATWAAVEGDQRWTPLPLAESVAREIERRRIASAYWRLGHTRPTE